MRLAVRKRDAYAEKYASSHISTYAAVCHFRNVICGFSRTKRYMLQSHDRYNPASLTVVACCI